MSKRKSNTAEDGLYFLPLGGAGEIGMNLNLYGIGPEDDRKWLMIDLGVTFGDDSTPGVDLIMADPSFIEDRADDLVGIVLTHAHEDHIGAVPHLWASFECPVYATPFTAALVRAKLEEAGLKNEVPLHEIPLGGSLDLDPFKLKFITLTHSIPEPNAIAIETRFGTVLHTGDWKIDPDPLIGEQTDEASLRALGDANVLAMVCDSTNVFEAGRAGSEGEVRGNLQELISPLTGRVAVTTFASNVARVRTVIEVADACGRHPVLVGRSMHRCVAAAKACGLLDGLPQLMDEAEAAHLPRDKVLYICTGSQGEP
ncbi:MAG: ribonuclease J, partial [Alphaproteobacteria bacterium]